MLCSHSVAYPHGVLEGDFAMSATMTGAVEIAQRFQRANTGTKLPGFA
ncbi:MAG: hypothetical protein ACLVJ6_10875 [Merdibacter sp.]